MKAEGEAIASRKGHFLLDFGDGLGRVQALGTYACAVHDGVAAVQAHGVVERRLALLLALVARVGQPAEGLQQHGRAQVLLRVPPVRRTRRRAARAQDTLVQAVELLAVLLALAVFTTLQTRQMTKGKNNG